MPASKRSVPDGDVRRPTGPAAVANPTSAQVERFRADVVRLDDRPGILAVAVSGGPDSMALLLLANAAFPGAVVAATVDHGLRADAADEAARVADVAAAVGVPHAILTVEVAKTGVGMQAAARDARYTALAEWMDAAGAVRLATAHHADDQAETLLMRLARGSGVTGLAGIRAARPWGSGRLIRPVLGWRRSELAGIVARAGIDPVEDPANRDLRHDRTHFRALLDDTALLPADRLAAAAGHLAEAETALDWLADEAWRGRATIGPDAIEIDVDGLPGDTRHRLAGRAMLRIGGEVADGEDVARMISRLESGLKSTLGGVLARPGARWRFGKAPVRRGK